MQKKEAGIGVKEKEAGIGVKEKEAGICTRREGGRGGGAGGGYGGGVGGVRTSAVGCPRNTDVGRHRHPRPSVGGLKEAGLRCP